MPELDLATRTQTAAADGSAPHVTGGRTIVRRRTLPAGRAVIGGFLIAAAAVVTFSAYTSATRAPRQDYIVAARSLVPGTRISAADLRVATLDVPDPSVRSQLFGSTAGLVGASVLARIPSGSLVEASEVVGRGGAPGTRELSIGLDPSRGRRDAQARRVRRPAEYVRTGSRQLHRGDGAPRRGPHGLERLERHRIGRSADDRVLAAPDGAAAEAIADAAIATQLTLVRAAEQPPGAPVTTLPPFVAQAVVPGGSG